MVTIGADREIKGFQFGNSFDAIKNDSLYGKDEISMTSDMGLRFSVGELKPNDKMEFNSLVITPSLFRHITEWEDSQYHIVLGINGNWYDWEFEVKVPELHIELGKLEYKYEYDIHKQFNGKDENGRIKWNASIYEPDVVTIDNINYISQLTDYAKQNCLQYIDGNELYKVSDDYINKESKYEKVNKLLKIAINI